MRTRVIAGLAILLTSCQAFHTQKQLSSEPRIDLATLGAVTARTSESDPPAEKRFHNIQALQGLPSSQLYPVMAMFSNSLGVTCSHCHGEYFEEETRPEKQIARQMIELTRAINKAQFQDEPTVTCFTCHRGRDYPLSAPDVAQAGWHKLLAPKPAIATLPDAASVLARYETAMPNGAAIARGAGEITIVGGLDERKNGTFTLAPKESGGLAIKATVQVPPPVERALAHWQFGAVDVPKRYDDTSVIRRRDDGGVVVSATAGDEAPDQLTFDPATGLLARAQTGTMTELGYVPEEIRFGDYRPVGGVPTPHLVEWARGDYLVTLRFSEVSR